MTTQNLIFLLVGAVAVFAALAAFGIAYRQSTKDAAWKDALDRDARKADKGVPAGIVTSRAATEASTDTVLPASTETVGAEDEADAAGPAVRSEVVRQVIELSPMEAGVSRRMFFTRALAGSFFGFLGLVGLASLSFAWPRVKGGFGSDVDAGAVEDILSQVFQADGSITPVFWPEAKSWIVPIADDALAGSQFGEANVAAGGLMALFQKCVHLGCRVPWCDTSQGFECPCHGSKYNISGEYEAGPAPRNLDRFVVEDVDGRFIIKTGQILESERAVVKSAKYPQGPSCIGG